MAKRHMKRHSTLLIIREMYRDFINRSNGMYINRFHCGYCVGDFSSPSFVKKLAPWTFCADFIQKDVADIDGEVFYELSVKTAKGFVWSFHTHVVLMVKHFWEPVGCDLVCICGIKLHSLKAETPVSFKEQA